MFQVILCEDNVVYRKRLEHYICEMNKIMKERFQVVLSTKSEQEVLAHLNANATDLFLLFLDIDLGNGSNGFDLALKCRKLNHRAYIVFISEHLEYVIQSFKVRPFDFLPKPVTLNRFSETLHRIVEDHDKGLCDGEKNQEKQKITLKNGSSQYNILLADVFYIEKLGNKCLVYTTNQIISVYKSLNAFENEFIEYHNLMRCHKSFIVNTDKIDKIDKVEKKIYLKNNMACDLGSKYKLMG